MTKPKKLLLASLLSFSVAFAQSYSDAKVGIAAGEDISSFKSLQKHPLYPYLAADFYRHNLHRDSEITALFNDHFSAPPIRQLHNKWIKDSYERGQFSQIVKHYYHTGSETAECLYRDAQLQLGNKAAAIDNIELLWLKPRSVSADCDAVFANWPGSTTAAYLLKRARLAYHSGNADFAWRMASKVSGDDAATLLRFIDFYRHPTTLLEVSASSLTASRLDRDLLPAALSRLVRQDSVRHAAFVMQFAVDMADNADYQKLLAKLVGYLANRQDAQAQYVYALLQNPDKSATQDLIRYLAGAQQWQDISQAITASNPDPMAQYWLGRALEKLGKDPKKAYRQAAKVRSYYGFLAADKLDIPYQFNADIIQANSKQQDNLNSNTVLIRAQALQQYGELAAARNEIIELAKHMDNRTVRQLAYWLDRHKFSFEAIYLLGKARDWNDINIRFPTPYNRQVQAASQLTGTEFTWIYAILRQESSMNPLAVSRAKAKGLMQLIPSTARRMAKDLGISLVGNAIFNPATNTKLGSKYLADMLARFDSVALASAAYNAGPGRVQQWLGEHAADDMPLWIEKIPFNETRKYVKRILEYQQVYAERLNKKIPRVSELMAVGQRGYNSQ